MHWLARRYGRERELSPVVFTAWDRLRARRCILKRSAHDQPGALEREHAHALAVRHPSIRGLRAALRDERGPVLVLEHIEGDAPDGTPEVAIALLRVLLHLHDRGLVHGDLKPENLLTEDGELRLIDLAFTTEVGARVLGGTDGFLAPEYLRGRPASVAGDLYAFGRTMRALGAPTRGPLGELVERACEEDPADRPASAAVALAALGAIALPEDRAGTLPWSGPSALRPLEETLLGHRGRTAVLVAPPGAGRTRITEELLRHAAGRWEAVADFSLAAQPTGLARLAELMETDRGRLAERALRAAARLATERTAILIDDADAADEDDREALAAMARALQVGGHGGLVVIGADQGLAARLGAEGATTSSLAPLDREHIAEVLKNAGARSNTSLVEALHARSGGRAGVVAEAALALARDPTRSDAEVLRDVVARLLPPEPTRVEKAEVPRLAEEAIERGEGRRAARLLRETFADALATDTKLTLLLVRALETSGHYDEALRRLEGQPEDHGTWRARLAARLGRHEEAIELAGDDARGCAVGAASALALGRLEEVDAFVKRGHLVAEEPLVRARLALLESDAALRRGDSETATKKARIALGAEPGAVRRELIAEAESRLGSACALGGDPEGARTHHRAALEAAHEAGDVGALPAYVVNVATAHHALGELGPAIGRYEEAARLSERLGREGMRAVALTNLGGLLVTIGARTEARAVLDEARRACERGGARLYAAQVELIEAERIAPEDRAGAIETAARAEARFEECGASRQALEAALLQAELAVDATVAEARAEELATAGLAARGHLLRARAALAEGRLARAREHTERAIEEAHEGQLEARAWALSAEVARACDAPDVEARRARAQEAYARVAETLPPGLRERFLAGAPTPPAPPRSPRSRSGALGDGGRRLLVLLRRVLLEGDERRVLEAAVDEAVALTGAERAFLLRQTREGEEILVARNLDRDTIRDGRFSRSVAERVIETAEPILTEMATADPSLSAARSIADLGLRSIVCAPIRSPSEIIGALYLDHRQQSARFDEDDLELVGALGDIIGMALENARLHREERERARELERVNREIRDENVQASIRLERLEQRLAAAGDTDPESGIVGQSRAIRQAIGVARRVAPSDLSVLIEGESGTGKELFARFVHEESHRRAGPFLAINCGALPETLLESELFGHVRGAFTGAHRDHPGLFRSAEGGTLFLDEIGEMPVRMQTRLLRVLQEREVRPVGADQAHPVDVRMVAATNRDLEKEIEAGSFRQDLYFRLVGMRLVLPPLRERLDDLPLLAEHALSQIAEEPGMRPVRLSKGALSALLSHPWPGNVRELWQKLRRGVLVAEGAVLEAEDLSLTAQPLDRQTALRRFDREIVEQALRAAGGNRTHAAKALGVSRMTIHRWIKRYDL